MTILSADRADETASAAQLSVDADAPSGTAGTDLPTAEPGGGSDPERPISPGLTATAAFLSTAAAGWLCGGIFDSMFARGVGVLGAVFGAAAVAVSYRTRRPSVVQYLGLGAAVVVGAVLVLPDADGGSANLPSLVLEAVRAGGLGSPPVAFDPGWRFILVVLTAAFAGGAGSLAVSLRRPRIAVFVPLPLLLGAAFVQPGDAPVALTVAAFVLIPAALTVAQGVDLALEGSSNARFELRRLARSLGTLGLIGGAIVALAQLGLLLPTAKSDEVIPPQRPQTPPAAADRVLFTVTSPRQGPWRLGVLDVYDGRGWLMPSYDPSRLLPVGPDGTVPGPTGSGTYTAAFTVQDVQGHVLPVVAGARRIVSRQSGLVYDPQTDMLRLPRTRPQRGLAYTVEAALPADAAALKAAPLPPPDIEPFVQVPPAPDAVVTLLRAAPSGNRFERLQYVRNALYGKVVAAGAGKPVDVPPSKVVAMLAGGQATPFEITAAEALLARWAGVPARVGYGYYGGDDVPGTGTLEIRPRHGATWLEVYFDGHGWIPIVGTPPKATASLNNNDKNTNTSARPSDRLAVSAYVPVRVRSVLLVFELVRYWAVRLIPIVALLFVAWSFYPGLLKALRRARRRRFAATGYPEAITVAYAELRDVANDLNIGAPAQTPLEFVREVDPDAEHEELAWLVTRALWGDLRRDLREDDAKTAETLARSVTRRLRRAQVPSTRVIAVGSRVSLRAPWTDDVPNMWLQLSLRRRVVAAIGRLARMLRRGSRVRGRLRLGRPVPGAAAGVVMLLSSFFLGGCAAPAGPPSSAATGDSVLPTPLVPETLGELRFERERSLERAYQQAGPDSVVEVGRNFSIRRGSAVVGALQVAAFKSDLVRSREDADDVRDGVVAGLGTGKFVPERVGSEIVLAQRQQRQDLFLWFPPDMSYFELLVADKSFVDAAAVFGQTLAYQRGDQQGAPAQTVLEPIDPRRGGLI